MNMWERGIFVKEVMRNQKVICCFGLHKLLSFWHPPQTKYPSGLYKETTKWEIFVFIKGRAAWQFIHAYRIWKIKTHCIPMTFENMYFLHTSGTSFLIDLFRYPKNMSNLQTFLILGDIVLFENALTIRLGIGLNIKGSLCTLSNV